MHVVSHARETGCIHTHSVERYFCKYTHTHLYSAEVGTSGGGNKLCGWGLSLVTVMLAWGGASSGAARSNSPVCIVSATHKSNNSFLQTFKHIYLYVNY